MRRETHVQVVDDVLRREQVDHADGERERRVVEEVPLDVVQQPRLGEVLDVGEPVLRWRLAETTRRERVVWDKAVSRP